MSPEDRKLARDLTRELRALGVSRGEADELARAARRLSHLRVPGMSRAARQRIEARLPFEVESHQERPARSTFRLQLRWAMAGSFAALAILAGTLVLFQGQHATPTNGDQQKAREVVQPITPDAQEIQEHIQQLQQLQEQPTVSEEEVQKAKDNFLRSYQEYERRHSNERDFDNPWRDYELEWWWRATQSGPRDTSHR